MGIKVVNNFLSKNYFDEVKRILEDPDFGWFFQANTVTGIEYKNNNEFYGFRHLFIARNEPNSSFGPCLLPIAWSAGDIVGGRVESVLTMYANLVLQKTRTMSDLEWYSFSAHTDGQLELEQNGLQRWTGLLYVDDADGDTVFFERDKSNRLVETFRQTPVANTLVMFPSRIEHSPGVPYKSFMRRVLNINILVKPTE